MVIRQNSDEFPDRQGNFTFGARFQKVLLDRVGLTVTQGFARDDQRRKELELANRLDGFAGDAWAMESDQRRRNLELVRKAGGEEDDWSDNASELLSMVERLGPMNANLTAETFVKPFFRDLRLPNSRMNSLDEDVLKFTNLMFLDVSQNALTCIENLPPKLKFLKAYGTQINNFTCKPCPTLCFLGLGHSAVSDDTLPKIASRFRNLLSLDLSFTRVLELQAVRTHLQPLRLQQLCLTACPAALLPFYRLKMIFWLPQLKLVDGQAVTELEQADAELVEFAPLEAPETLNLSLKPLRLECLRSLLPKAEQPTAEEGEEPSDPIDAVVEACQGGSLVLQVELPQGRLEESVIPLEVQTEPEDPKAKKGEEPPPQEPQLDSLQLEHLELHYELPLASALPALRAWLRRGLRLRLLFRPPLPTREEEEGQEGAAAEGQHEGDAEAAEPPPLEPLPDVALGGMVISLDDWLFDRPYPVSEEMRKQKAVDGWALPEKTDAWPLTVRGAYVVPHEPKEAGVSWLDAEVQVPQAANKRTLGSDDAARLDMDLALYADAPPPAEEEAPAS